MIFEFCLSPYVRSLGLETDKATRGQGLSQHNNRRDELDCPMRDYQTILNICLTSKRNYDLALPILHRVVIVKGLSGFERYYATNKERPGILQKLVFLLVDLRELDRVSVVRERLEDLLTRTTGLRTLCLVLNPEQVTSDSIPTNRFGYPVRFTGPGSFLRNIAARLSQLSAVARNLHIICHDARPWLSVAQSIVLESSVPPGHEFGWTPGSYVRKHSYATALRIKLFKANPQTYFHLDMSHLTNAELHAAKGLRSTGRLLTPSVCLELPDSGDPTDHDAVN